ncbi:hypothetical protein [Mariniflexile sp.]|uniref:hypothetical protein n=1 Tax=Mariniflexile sp. TaxID=1979402 RepID=UPI00356A2DCC
MSVILNSFSQEVNIPTEFSYEGVFYKTYDKATRTFTGKITEFKSEEPCTVIEYLGKDVFKIKYKDWLGYVDSEHLVFNEEMSNLFYDFQEKERLKLLQHNAERQKRIQEIVNKNSEQFNETEVQDTIIKFRESENLQLEAESSLAKKQQLEHIEKTKQKSVSKTQNLGTTTAKKTLIVKEISNDSVSKESLELIKFRNTCHYTMNEYDVIDRVKIVRTEPYKINDNVSIELFKRGNSINIFFYLKADLGCSSYLPSNRSSVTVKLENNQSITFYHTWEMNCGDFAFKGPLLKTHFALLQKSPIKSIVLRGSKKSQEETNINYKEFFIDKLSCIE